MTEECTHLFGAQHIHVLLVPKGVAKFQGTTGAVQVSTDAASGRRASSS